MPLDQARGPHALSVIEDPQVVNVKILALVGIIEEIDRYVLAVVDWILKCSRGDTRVLDEKIRRVSDVGSER